MNSLRTPANADRFRAAADAVLEHLDARYPCDCWLVIRIEENSATVESARGPHAEFEAGMVFPWTGSLCATLFESSRYGLVENVQAIPACRESTWITRWNVEAFHGTAIRHANGSLAGCICAMHRARQSSDTAPDPATIDLMARLLGSIHSLEQEMLRNQERADRFEADSLTDPLTNVYNRRGWDRLLAAEESRCQRTAHIASVIAIDLDGLKSINDRQGHAAGDIVLQKAAAALRACMRQQDVLARVGGDEFAVLAVDCDNAGREALEQRLHTALTGDGVSASLGSAVRRSDSNLLQCWQDADTDMYQRRTARNLRPQ